MKKLIISTIVASGMAVAAFGQGTVFLDNQANTGVFGGAGGTPFNGTSGDPVYSSLVTKNGLIFTPDPSAQAGHLGYTSTDSQMLGIDVNVAVWGGASATTATNLIASLTGSAITGDNANWGQLLISGSQSAIPGSTAGATIYLDVQAWEGNFASYYAAEAGNEFYLGDTGVFANASGGITASGPVNPPDLTGMPDLFLGTPEPSTFALSSLGAAALFLFRRKK